MSVLPASCSRRQLLEGIAHLPDREGYLWLKTRSAEAIKIRTAKVALPEGDAFRKCVEELRQDACLGGRLSQAQYSDDIAARDREWFEGGESPLLEDRWERVYQRQEALWQE